MKDDLQQSLMGLSRPAVRAGGLAPIRNPAPIAPTVSRATAIPPKQTGGGGGGIASPLTEASAAARTFHPVKYYTSSDGVFVLAVRPLASVALTDAGQAEVVINFANPA